MVGHFQPDILSVGKLGASENVKKDGGIGYGLRYLNQNANDTYRASATFNYLGQYTSDGFVHWCAPIEDGACLNQVKSDADTACSQRTSCVWPTEFVIRSSQRRIILWLTLSRSQLDMLRV